MPVSTPPATPPGKEGQPRRGFYTILILPHAADRFRKLHLSRNFVYCVGAIGAVFLFAALAAPHLWLSSRTTELRLERLQMTNEQLHRDSDYFEGRLGDLSRRIAEFETQTGALARELGVDDLPTLQPAGGEGASLIPRVERRVALDQELGAIQSRADGVDVSLDRLDHALEVRVRQLAATPDRMPSDGWFSHGYGWRIDPFGNGRQFHRGIDIVAEMGADVVAPADGVVTRATRQPQLGKTVDIDHGYGYITRYAHLSEILVESGQQIRRGEKLGLIGSTGRSTGPHLHYEVFRDGRRVNPWKYLNP